MLSKQGTILYESIFSPSLVYQLAFKKKNLYLVVALELAVYIYN